MSSTDTPSAKPKSIIVWNYEILLVLTGLFSLWNYGTISLGTMNVPDKTEESATNATSSGAASVDTAASASGNGDVFLFTVLATAAALTILALIRLVFRTHFSAKMLHSPWLLVVFSIPIVILVSFAALMVGMGAVSL